MKKQNDELDEILQPAKQEHMELELLRHPRNLESINDDGEMYINYTKQQILDWHEKECEKRVLEAKVDLVRTLFYMGGKDSPQHWAEDTKTMLKQAYEGWVKELSE